MQVWQSERLIAGVPGHPLEPDRVGVRQVGGHRVDEGVVAWMDADLGRHLDITGALGAEGALEDLDHLGSAEADGLHVGPAQVADWLARHRRSVVAVSCTNPRSRRPDGQTGRVRVLFSSSRGAGHFNPLVPFARAFERAGHELLFAGPPELAEPAEAAGFRFWRLDPPPEDELGPIWARVPELPPEEANEVVVREVFGRLNTTAHLPRMRAAFDEWRPDVLLRDPNEYSAALVAEQSGIAHGRIAISLMSTEQLGSSIAAPAIDAIRRAEGLPADPGGGVLRASPWLSVFPRTLDEGEQGDTHRFRDPAWEEEPKDLPGWWPGREADPLVYMTFGSVAGSFPQALPAYALALTAVADLPARVLLTVGRDLELE